MLAGSQLRWSPFDLLTVADGETDREIGGQCPTANFTGTVFVCKSVRAPHCTINPQATLQTGAIGDGGPDYVDVMTVDGVPNLSPERQVFIAQVDIAALKDFAKMKVLVTNASGDPQDVVSETWILGELKYYNGDDIVSIID